MRKVLPVFKRLTAKGAHEVLTVPRGPTRSQTVLDRQVAGVTLGQEQVVEVRLTVRKFATTIVGVLPRGRTSNARPHRPGRTEQRATHLGEVDAVVEVAFAVRAHEVLSVPILANGVHAVVVCANGLATDGTGHEQALVAIATVPARQWRHTPRIPVSASGTSHTSRANIHLLSVHTTALWHSIHRHLRDARFTVTGKE